MAEREEPHTAADGFADTNEEAQRRYERWRIEDPFADLVEPALLNSGDLADYVAATGMIHPFEAEEDKEKIKLASYEGDLFGKCVTFTGNRRKDMRITQIKKGDQFLLGANEIAFVQLEPYFRIPEYIALRYNLRITHVYRGLLLGTGPLVDPGFEGYLWIPLHNLTANSYVLRGGEGLVWMEFTKLSRRLSDAEKGKRQHLIGEFPEAKKERKDILDYLQAADPHRAIRSSIPVEVGKATKEAQSAKRAARTAAGLIGVISLAVVLAAVALVYGSWQLVNDVRDTAEDAFRKVDRLEQQLIEIEDERSALRQGTDRRTGPPSP